MNANATINLTPPHMGGGGTKPRENISLLNGQCQKIEKGEKEGSPSDGEAECKVEKAKALHFIWREDPLLYELCDLEQVKTSL